MFVFNRLCACPTCVTQAAATLPEDLFRRRVHRFQDFAGQPVYYDSHRKFIGPYSLQLLVVNLEEIHKREHIRRTCWWLRTVRDRTRIKGCSDVRSATIVVATHAEKLFEERRTTRWILLWNFVRIWEATRRKSTGLVACVCTQPRLQGLPAGLCCLVNPPSRPVSCPWSRCPRMLSQVTPAVQN